MQKLKNLNILKYSKNSKKVLKILKKTRIVILSSLLFNTVNMQYLFYLTRTFYILIDNMIKYE